MAIDSMFVKPEIAIKEEAPDSFDQEDSFSDTSSQAPSDSSNSSALPAASQGGSGEGTTQWRMREDESADREDVKVRLASKKQEIERARFVLSKFPKWLQESEELIPEAGDWIADIEAILAHSELPRVVLGFMGQSGCGKSSVINALLDEEDLLPCSCMEACTAVAVEIAWNRSNDISEAYKCVVEFITVDEWKEELEGLIADVLDIDPGGRSNLLNGDVSIAAAKIKAVYPHLDLDSLIPESAAELLNDDLVSKILGEQKIIKAAAGKSKAFASEIKTYIDSSSKAIGSRGKSLKSVPYWPLVKVVKIYTKSRVLSKGLVLVDLPGSGDSNAARASVAEQYMQSVEAICIVADIRRALSDSVARNLFGKGDMLKRRLLRNGLLDEERTFFVLTCIDIINNRQVIDTQGLQDDTEVMEILTVQQSRIDRKEEISQRLRVLEERKMQRLRMLQQLARTIRVLESDSNGLDCEGRKRKRADLESENDAEAGGSEVSKRKSYLATSRGELEKKKKAQQILNKEMEDLITEKNGLEDDMDDKTEHQLTAVCIKKRNSHVIHRMGIDFSLGLSDLERDLNEEGDEAAGSVPKSKPTICRNGASTFCVCAKAFQKLRGRFGQEKMPSGFGNLNDTSLPQLANHCEEFTLNAQERLADRFLADLRRLTMRMRQWADNTIPDRLVTMQQKRKLEDKFKEHKSVFRQTVLEFIDSIDVKISNNITGLKRGSLGVAVKMSIGKTPEIFEDWINHVPSGPTWKAICRKGGVHKSKSSGTDRNTHNWNDDLADGLIKFLDRNLNSLFNEVLPAVQGGHLASMESVLKGFPSALAASCLLIDKHIANPLQNLLHTLSRHEAEMQRSISNRFALAITTGRIADQKVPLRVRRAMNHGYTTAANTKGKGSVQAAKDVIETHIEHVKASMYNGAAKDVVEAVDNVMLMLKGNLQKDLETRFSKIESDFEKMLVTATATPRPEKGPWKIKLQTEVLEKLTAFDAVLAELQPLNGIIGVEMNPNHQAGGMDGKDSHYRLNLDNNEQTNGLDATTSEILDMEFEYEAFSDEED